MLRLAAVIGRDFSHVQVSTLTDLSDEDLLLLLEEALAAHVIEELPDAAGAYRFTHALIQETLADELSATRRARLHARVGEALEALYGDEVEAHAAELAHHFAEARTVLGSQKLIHYFHIAGERALAAYAYEEALAYFEQALAAKGDQPMDDESAGLLFGLARAQLATLAANELEPAVAGLQRAFDHYADAGQLGRAVAAAAYPLPLSLGLGQTRMVELLVQGLTLVPHDSVEEGRLLASYGWFAGVNDGDLEAAQRSFRRALVIAGRRDDGTLERRTLANAAFADAFHLRWPESLQQGLRSIELAEDAGDLHTEMVARRAVAWALTATGESEQAVSHAVVALAHAEKLRERWWLASTSFTRGVLALYEGDWRAARELTDLGLSAQPLDPRLFGVRLVLEYSLGDYGVGRAYLGRLQEAARSAPPGPVADHIFVASLIPLVSRIACSDEGLDAAEATAEGVLSLPRIAPGLAMVAKVGKALIAVERADGEAAASLYGELEPQRGTGVFLLALAVDRLLGLLAATCDRIDPAFGHFEDGLAFCERAGYRPEYAWTAADYADALLQRGGTADRTRAVALQTEALAIARELGMRPLVERVTSR